MYPGNGNLTRRSHAFGHDETNLDKPLLLSNDGSLYDSINTSKSVSEYNSSTRMKSTRNVRLLRHSKINQENVTSPVLSKGNPIQDLSGFFSHGCCCVQCVRTKEVGVMITFGEFQKLLKPGFICMMWPCTRIAGRLSLRIQQLDVVCETKTKDNVFLNISLSIQFQVIIERAFDAFFKLTNVEKQIQAYVFDVVRSTIPKLDLDDVFTSKSDIALDVLRALQGVLAGYGYAILETLVTDISPDAVVKESMNEIEASKRFKYAMRERGEAVKITKIKEAEAASEALHLQGVGISRKQQMIALGMKESMADFKGNMASVNPKDIMDILLLTQYMDMMNSLESSHSVVLRSNPGEALRLRQQVSSLFASSENSPKVNPDEHVAPDLLW
mmetsp:Transcript_23790/g.27410  ORF Transcript_23790/g.27410 Transcript_23790/m.27410 type:complete len:386 (+) Transcript_23790:48-1205(+)